MACINPDGSITQSAKAVLQSLQLAKSPRELSSSLGFPLFKIRSSLREMEEAGLILKTEDEYIITDLGRELLG